MKGHISMLAVALAMTLISRQVYGEQQVFMDSPTACGTIKPAGERDVFVVKPRGSVGVSNPPTSCTVTFESTYSDTNYKFEIVLEAAQFTDCGMSLKIFDGPGGGGAYIRELGCGTSSSTGHFYSKGRSVSLQLGRLRDEYVFGNHFQLRIQLYYDSEGASQVTGSDSFPVGGIVGIVLGLIVIVAAAIFLGWCYKTGRLPGADPYEYPSTTKQSMDNLSKSELDGGGGASSNGAFVAWHNTEGKSVMSDSRSNFDLDDSRVWESLTNVTQPKKGKDSMLNSNPPGRGYSANNNNQNNRGRSRGAANFERLDPNQLSNSPNTRVRGRGRDYYNDRKDDPYNTINDNFERQEAARQSAGLMKGSTFGKGGDEKNRNSAGVFVNPDKEGYMYDYDHVKELEGKGEGKKTQDFATELQAAIRRASLKRQKSENQSGDSEAQEGKSGDGMNESSDFNSTPALNKQTDGETTGPEAQSSPKPVKKKRKNSKERKSPKSSRKHRDKSGENSPQKSPRTKSRKSKNLEDEENLPPEAFAPIFSGDEEPSTSMDYEYQYQPGYQGNYPPAAPFDPRYPMGPYQPGMPGMYPPGMPYQTAGQAQWYVEANPNGQHKMAFAMQTHSQSDDSLQGPHGAPNYTSTPYQPGHYGHPSNESALVPAGTILDDPRLPQPGTSVMRYDDDPLTGVKTSQVVWTDAKKDPTDPPPDSASQVTRKTITRLTTRSTEDQLTDAPNPSLQDMSWRAAHEIQATGGQEPAFMAPTGGALYHNNAIQYANQTPDRSNASYYMGSQHPPHNPTSAQSRQYHTGAPPPVIHEEPSRSQAFKDTIVLNSDSQV